MTDKLQADYCGGASTVQTIRNQPEMATQLKSDPIVPYHSPRLRGSPKAELHIQVWRVRTTQVCESAESATVHIASVSCARFCARSKRVSARQLASPRKIQESCWLSFQPSHLLCPHCDNKKQQLAHDWYRPISTAIACRIRVQHVMLQDHAREIQHLEMYGVPSQKRPQDLWVGRPESNP